MATYKTAGLGTYTLAGSISSTATSITLSSFTVPITGTNVTMASLGTTTAYGTLSPGTADAEFISFTGITQNANGTATLTGVTRGLNKETPYTTSSSFKRPHTGQALFILSNSPNVYDQFPAKVNDETITGKWTFPNDANTPVIGASYVAPTTDTQVATKKYVDDTAVAGAPDASTTTKGIVQIATQAQADARTTTGSTGALLVPTPGLIRSVLTHDYAADAGSTDAYAITLTPAITAYTTGDIYYFKANTINTGACTLNVNAVGAKSLKFGGSDPYDGYIAAGAYVACQYDGTNMNIIWCSSAPAVSVKGTEIYAVDSVGTDAYAITPSPAISAYTAGQRYFFKAGTANTGACTLAVSGLTAKTIKKNYNQDTSTGDILAGQIVGVSYDSVNDCWQMITPVSTGSLFSVGTDLNGYNNFTVPIIPLSATTMQGWTLAAGGTISVTTTIVAGAQSVTLSDGGGGAFTASTAIAGTTADNYTYDINKAIRIKMRIKLADTSDRKGFGLAITAANIHTAQTDTTNGEIRFLWNGSTLYAQNANGTATSTDISSGITATVWNSYEIVFTPGVSILYYVNNTLKATHTTNLPTTGTPLLVFGANTNNRSVTTSLFNISVEQ